jgi:trimeric autotransporter adhesin
MKKNYLLSNGNYFSKSSHFFLLTFIALFLFGISTKAQTTVFSEDFNRAGYSPGGTPLMDWVTGSTASPSGIAQFTGTGAEYSLQISNPSSLATTAAPSRTFVTGTLSTFLSPFAPVLSSNTDLVTWTFNVLARRPSSPPRGFGDTQTGYAVILAMTGSDPTNLTTNGYAVTIKSTGPSSGTNAIRLVRFKNGLISNANTDSIIGVFPIGNVNWASVKVTYTPTTNAWSLFVSDDGLLTNPEDPNVVFTQVATSAIDATYTSDLMTNFGFFWNEGTGKANVACYGSYDNFKVTVGPTVSAVSEIKDNSSVYVSNGKLMFYGGEVYNSIGVKVASVKLSSEQTAISLRQGVYIVKSDGKSQKILIK